MSNFISEANYNLSYLLLEGPKTRKANDAILLTKYIQYARPCGYELLIQDNIAAAGMGPVSQPGSNPHFCYGTSSGADCSFTDKSGKIIQCEVKTKGGNKATSQGMFSAFVGQPVYDDAKKAWDKFKNSKDHEELWHKWISKSMKGRSLGKHKLTLPKGKIDARKLAKLCVRDCKAYVEGNFTQTGVSNLRIPYMISASNTAAKKLSYTKSGMEMGAYKQPGSGGVQGFVQSAYAGVAYIQVEEHGLFILHDGWDPLQLGVPLAALSCSLTQLSWKRPGSRAGVGFSFKCGVSGIDNQFYIAEKGGCTAENKSKYSLDVPKDCTALAMIAKQAGTI
jgi:hypothetical protein